MRAAKRIHEPSLTPIAVGHRAFLGAEFDSALAAVDGQFDLASTLLRARTYLMMKRFPDAMRNAITAYLWSRSEEEKIVSSSIAARVAIHDGDLDDAARWLAISRNREWPSLYARSSYGYAAASLAFARADYDACEALMMDALACNHPDTRARALHLQAHLYSAKGDYRRHAGLLSATLAVRGQREVYTRASTIMQLSIIAREMSQTIDVAPIEAAYASLPWTRATAELQFLSCHNLAWYHALEGSYLRAYRLADQSMSAVPNSAWLVTAHASYASFAFAAGEDVTAKLHLEKALAVIDSVNWKSLKGEERSGLLDVAILMARIDSTKSRAVLKLYESLDPLPSVLAYAHGDLAKAELDFAHGMLPPTTAACVARLEAAYEIFAKAGYAWRAAEASTAIARITESSVWLSAATHDLARFPRSWLARDLRRRTEDVRLRYPTLTNKEVKVTELVSLGLTDKDIALRLSCSVRTVQHHVSSILKKTGASSRRSLQRSRVS